MQEFERNHKIGARINGKYTMVRNVNKRPYPNGICELCGRKSGLLGYHHWDDSQIKPGASIAGIWLCAYCHHFAERLDEGAAEIYVTKKAAILREFPINTPPQPIILPLIEAV